jgi:uncharacterized membrane protein YidH (DUF202 family)
MFLLFGFVFLMLGVMSRGALILAMRNSHYSSRFSYLATWFLVSPLLFVGIVMILLTLH